MARMADVAIEHNQMTVLHWLHGEASEIAWQGPLLCHLMGKPCMHGRLDIAQWVWNLASKKEDIDDTASNYDGPSVMRDTSNARVYLVFACKSGNVALAEWLVATMDFRPLTNPPKTEGLMAAFLLQPEAAERRFLSRLFPAAVCSGVIAMACCMCSRRLDLWLVRHGALAVDPLARRHDPGTAHVPLSF